MFLCSRVVFLQLAIRATVINQGTQCPLIVALSVPRINIEKEAKLNSITFLPMLKEETCGFVPCVVITGVLKSTPGYAVNTSYQVIHSYMYQ